MMDFVLATVVAFGLLMVAWPWLLLGAMAALVSYLIWSAIRRREGHLD